MDTFLKNSGVREAVPAEGYMPYTKEQIFAFLSLLPPPSLPFSLHCCSLLCAPTFLTPSFPSSLSVACFQDPIPAILPLLPHFTPTKYPALSYVFLVLFEINSYQYSHYALVSRSPRPRRIVPGYWLRRNSSNTGGPLHNSLEVVHLETPVFAV